MVQLQEFPVPTDEIHFQNSNVVAVIEQVDLGKGTLYVSESYISWKSAASGEGFQLDYPRMCLHAISRDTNVNPIACIYIMVNGKFCADADDVGEISEEEEDLDPEVGITEIKLAPDDSELLQTIYSAIQVCSLLNPDPSSDMSVEEEEEDDEADIGGGGDYEDYDSDDYDGRAPGMDGTGDNGDISHPNPNQFDDAD